MSSLEAMQPATHLYPKQIVELILPDSKEMYLAVEFQ